MEMDTWEFVCGDRDMGERHYVRTYALTDISMLYVTVVLTLRVLILTFVQLHSEHFQ